MIVFFLIVVFLFFACRCFSKLLFHSISSCFVLIRKTNKKALDSVTVTRVKKIFSECIRQKS